MNTGTTAPAGATSTGGIATVAQRIRDRAHQLSSTRSTLSHLRTTVSTTRAAVASARTDHAAARSDLLEAIRSRHGVELEVLAVRRRTAKVEEEAGRRVQSKGERPCTSSKPAQLSWRLRPAIRAPTGSALPDMQSFRGGLVGSGIVRAGEPAREEGGVREEQRRAR